MRLNLDIWHEIIGYLEYPEDRGTLHSLAVTSKVTSCLALDVIWRSGEILPTIVSVMNSFANLEDGPFLECRVNRKITSRKARGGGKKGFSRMNTAEAIWVCLVSSLLIV